MSLDQYRDGAVRSRIWLRKIEQRNRFAEKLNKMTGEKREEMVRAYQDIFGTRPEYCLPL